MRDHATIFIPGIPRPGGSKKTFVPQRNGQVIRRANGSVVVNVVDDAKGNKEWRRTVAAHASNVMGSDEPLTGPLRVDFTFFMPRPDSHYGTGRNVGTLKASAPYYHTVKPDRTKLTRSTEDAMTGIVWRDDAQIVDGRTIKRYVKIGERPGAIVTVTPVEDQP